VKLDKKERIIKEFQTELKIDVMILEIIEKDNIIDNAYFLLPYMDYDENNEKFLGEEIQIIQYPEGKLSYSPGKILEKKPNNDYLFYHNVNTLPGSSGSPIVLKGEEKVIAIHKGWDTIVKKNAGFFIGIIIEIMMTYKKNGEGKEYYKNGMIKYKGNFFNDEYNGEGIEYYETGKVKYEGKFLDGQYNGEGKFYEENDEIYLGQFKNGAKNGDGCVFKDNKLIKEGKFENNKFLDEEEELNEENEDNHEDNNEEVENGYEEEEKNDDNSDNTQERVGNNPNNNNNIINSNNNNNNSNNNNHNKNYNNNYNNNLNNNNNIYNNNFNNITNIKINNNNYDNKNKGIWKTVETQAYHLLHPIGNLIGIRCKRCDHLVKSHIKIEFGKWRCDECPKNNNICIKA